MGSRSSSPVPSWRRTPFADGASRLIAGRMGMWLLLASLGMLFATTLVIFLVLRLQIGAAHDWPALPPLPRILWVSTILLIASSITMQSAVNAARSARLAALRRSLTSTAALGVGFLAMQTAAWVQWLAPAMSRWVESETHRFALTSFYVFTGLHAAHVVGGLLPLIIIAARAWLDRRTPPSLAAVEYCAMYWHFLDIAWLAVFACMLIGM